MSNPERSTRRTALADFLISEVGKLWGKPGGTWSRHEHADHEQLREQLLSGLDATFSREDLVLGTAELLIFEDRPEEIEWWGGSPGWNDWEKRQRIGFGCWLWQGANPTEEAGQLFMEELRWESRNPDNSVHSRYYLPLDVVRVWAGMPVRFPGTSTPPDTTANPIAVEILKTFLVEGLQPWPGQRAQVGESLGEILALLKNIGELTTEHCRAALTKEPSVAISNAAMRTLDAELGEVIYEFAAELSEENSERFCYFGRQRGARWVVRACENVERLALSSLQSKKPDAYDRNHAIRKIANIKSFLPDDDMDAFQNELDRFSPQTRLLVSACSSVAAEHLLASTETALPPELDEFRDRFLGMAGDEYSPFDNSTDPTVGVFPITEFRGLAERMGEAGRNHLLEEFAQLGERGRNALTLLKGLFEVDRPKIEKALRSNGQAAIKAYGMFSLPAGKKSREQELLTRYQRITEFIERSNGFKAERRTKSIAAAHAALSNLAQLAGFPDSTQLQFSLEAMLASQSSAPAAALDEPPYRVHIELDSSRPELVIAKDGRILKSAPAALKASGKFKKLRQDFDLQLIQSRRFAAMLEAGMAAGRPMEASMIDAIRAIPLARPLLARLLLRAEDGHTGLLDEEATDLIGLRSSRHPLSPTFQIAHPLQLHQDGILAEWQKEIESLRIVPPFPQADREIYLPASLETGEPTIPSGLVGSTVKSGKAANLLGSLGWSIQTSPDDYPIVYKDYPESRTRAFLLIAEPEYRFTTNPVVTINEICFGSMADRWFNHFDHLDIKSVFPLTFSETMRDISAVIAAA